MRWQVARNVSISITSSKTISRSCEIRSQQERKFKKLNLSFDAAVSQNMLNVNSLVNSQGCTLNFPDGNLTTPFDGHHDRQLSTSTSGSMYCRIWQPRCRCPLYFHPWSVHPRACRRSFRFLTRNGASTQGPEARVARCRDNVGRSAKRRF